MLKLGLLVLFILKAPLGIQTFYQRFSVVSYTHCLYLSKIFYPLKLANFTFYRLSLTF